MPRRHTSVAIYLLALAAATAFVAPAARADDTAIAIGKAETHYRKGRLGKAFTQLEEAATLVARQLAARYAETFPAAPSGWTAKPVSSSAEGKRRLGRDVILDQKYSQNGGEGEMTAQLFVVGSQTLVSVIKGLRGAEARRTERTIVPIHGAGKAFVKFDESSGTGAFSSSWATISTSEFTREMSRAGPS